MEKLNDNKAVGKIIDFLKLKLIDKYIIRKFLGTFFFCIVLILTIAVVFDFAEKIDNFNGQYQYDELPATDVALFSLSFYHCNIYICSYKLCYPQGEPGKDGI